MTDTAHGSKEPPTPGAPFDSEIDVRRIFEIGAWLAAITVGSLVVGYFFYRGLGKYADRSDPTPSPLVEASRPVEPPAPRLQVTPERDLKAFREANQVRLSSWGWVDQATGVAHMPIDEAIARLAVPDTAPAAPAGDATPSAPATTAPDAHAAAPEAPAAH